MDVIFCENVLFELWNLHIPRQRWINAVADHLKIGIYEARALLEGRRVVVPRELSALASRFCIDEEDLLHSDLVADSNLDVLKTNVDFLFGTVGRGGKKDAAQELEVHETTISAWLSGKQSPTRKNQHALIRLFGLKPTADIERDRIFLSLQPVGHLARVEWVVSRVAEVQPDDLRDLFPALHKMLGEV